MSRRQPQSVSDGQVLQLTAGPISHGQVLLWTFCLLASCAAPVHGHSYLIRETVSVDDTSWCIFRALGWLGVKELFRYQRSELPAITGMCRNPCYLLLALLQQTLKLASGTAHPVVAYTSHVRQPKLSLRFEHQSVTERNAEQTYCSPRVDEAGLLAALRGFPVVGQNQVLGLGAVSCTCQWCAACSYTPLGLFQPTCCLRFSLHDWLVPKYPTPHR